MRVELRRPSRRDEAEFLRLVRQSRSLHRPWVSPPSTPALFRAYLARCRDRRHAGFLVCLSPAGEIAGVVNLNEIVHGALRSAYLGYYSFAPHADRGCMRAGLSLALRHAFGELRLHRVEANIQPGNEASIALVRRLGFSREGFSRRYLKIGGRWRDHQRWALLADDWRRRGPGAAERDAEGGSPPRSRRSADSVQRSARGEPWDGPSPARRASRPRRDRRSAPAIASNASRC
jgi:[ribosomal protein S5]-alanine N-acetyltransferase